MAAKTDWVDGNTFNAAAANALGAEVNTKATAYTGQTPTIWYGTQSAYDALSSGTKNAAGFIAVIQG